MAYKDELIKTLRIVFLEIFPEFKGYHFPIRAKVVKVNETGGTIDEFNKRYSADVQPLNPDGSIDETSPIIPDVEIPVIWSGPGRGIFCLPVIGSIVRIGFYYYDPSLPFIDAILGDGFDIPDHALGSIIIQHSSDTWIEIDPSKNIKLIAPTAEIDLTAPLINFAGGGHPVAFADVVKQIFDGHVHPLLPGVTAPPTSSMSGHESSKVFTG